MDEALISHVNSLECISASCVFNTEINPSPLLLFLRQSSVLNGALIEVVQGYPMVTSAAHESPYFSCMGKNFFSSLHELMRCSRSLSFDSLATTGPDFGSKPT